MKTIRIFICKRSVFDGEIFNLFEYACFHNGYEGPLYVYVGIGQEAGRRDLIWFYQFHPSYLHYENTPIQIYWNFHHQKLKVFRIKIRIFFIFLLKT